MSLQIGITGGIGSGKSTVCRVFECLGIPVYNADDRAKWLSNYHPEIKKEVIELLGIEAYDSKGEYNRPFVSAKVFSDAALLTALNKIIHPRVAEDTEAWLIAHKGAPYVLKEAAIMGKAGVNNTLDFVIVVNASEEVRIARVRQRDARTEEQILSIIRNQISDEERAAIADFTIDNSGTIALIPQVLQIHKHLLQII